MLNWTEWLCICPAATYCLGKAAKPWNPHRIYKLITQWNKQRTCNRYTGIHTYTKQELSVSHLFTNLKLFFFIFENSPSLNSITKINYFKSKICTITYNCIINIHSPFIKHLYVKIPKHGKVHDVFSPIVMFITFN